MGVVMFATTAAIGILRYPVRRRGLMIGVYLAPLFVAQVLIGISTLMFNRNVLGIPATSSRRSWPTRHTACRSCSW